MDSTDSAAEDFWVSEATKFSNGTSTNGTTLAPSVGEAELSKFSPGVLTIAAIAVIIFAVLGIVGNLLTILAILRSARLRGVTAAFIISLSVADFLFSVFVLPLEASRFIHHTWIYSDELCFAFPLVRYVNVGVSLLSITFITVNRYVMIAHSHSYERIYTRCNIVLTIAFIWLFSVAMNLPTVLGIWGRFGYDPTLRTCTIVAVNGKSPKEALFLVGFLVPCIVIVYCYTRIFWLVRRSESTLRSTNRSLKMTAEDRALNKDLKSCDEDCPQPASESNALSDKERNHAPGGESEQSKQKRREEKRASGTHSQGRSPEDPSGATQGRQLPKQRARMRKKSESARESRRLKTNEWRITKMVLAIFLAYVLCYLPITIVKVVDPRVDFPGLHIVGYLLIYMSACLNPIIYGVMNKQYRQAYHNAILCQKQLWLKSITSTNDFNTVGKSSPSANQLAEGDERMTLVTSFGTSVVLTRHQSSPKRVVGTRNGTALPTVSEDTV